ncbi:MAG: peroxidase [Actinobacteria bacterium]|nr:peroxidase [Actinomycetota bacterium]
MPQNHPTAPRGAGLAPRSIFLEGRFGRMFRNLAPFEPDPASLTTLAGQMPEPPDPGTEGGAEDEGLDGPIPAGYTYLGQFIDHDITFDPVSSLQRLNDPEGLINFRTPRFDLDSLYGDGPNNNPFMYDQTVDGGKTSFLLGQNEKGERDLPRVGSPPSLAQGRALIGDPRNDENVIVGQLHLLFLTFHNKVVETIRAEQPVLSEDILFEEAQRWVRWHYQWAVVHDFLGRIVGQDVIDDILSDDQYAVLGGKASVKRIHLQFYRWQCQPFMPVEFSVAAYRFGHSMIRPDYRLNNGTPEIPIFTSGELREEHQDLRGFRPLASDWTIDWSRFFEIGDNSSLQRARKIDTQLAAPLSDVPATNEPHRLAERNLLRGRALKLPSGQRVSRAMGIEPLSDDQLALTAISDEFLGSAPLWFYVLKEAEIQTGGASLGPVGGRIVAEVLLGMLKGDPFSYINIEPNWEPFLGQNPQDFTMGDLVAFTLGQGTQEDPPQPGGCQQPAGSKGD